MVDVVERSSVYEMLDKIQDDVCDGDGFQHDKWVEYVDGMKMDKHLVEVITCEDCKWWDTERNDYRRPDYHYCEVHNTGRISGNYCSFAKRREE